MLCKQHLDHFDPVLHEDLYTHGVSVDIVGAEALHSKIVYESVFLDTINAISYRRVGDVS